MRPILANLLIASFPSNSFPNSSTPPLNTPSSSPLLRPTSSPMTPITPLVLSDSTNTGNDGHYEKENFFSNEAGYFFHNHHEELYTTSYYYTEQYYNNDNRNTAVQSQVTDNINNPSPLSSGVTTPTNTISFNAFNPNSTQPVNNYVNHQMMLSYNNNNYTAPSQISSGMNFNHYYNQQFYTSDNNVNLQYDTLKNTYHHNHLQNQDDVQLHEMITGLNKMDIVDSL